MRAFLCLHAFLAGCAGAGLCLLAGTVVVSTRSMHASPSPAMDSQRPLKLYRFLRVRALVAESYPSIPFGACTAWDLTLDPSIYFVQVFLETRWWMLSRTSLRQARAISSAANAFQCYVLLTLERISQRGAASLLQVLPSATPWRVSAWLPTGLTRACSECSWTAEVSTPSLLPSPTATRWSFKNRGSKRPRKHKDPTNHGFWNPP